MPDDATIANGAPHVVLRPMLLDVAGVAAVLSIGRRSVERLVGTHDRFPRPVKIAGLRRRLWRTADLLEYVGNLQAEPGVRR